jgi:hypothetical protein
MHRSVKNPSEKPQRAREKTTKSQIPRSLPRLVRLPGSTFLSSLFPISFTRASSHKYPSTKRQKERNLNIIETQKIPLFPFRPFPIKKLNIFFYVELSVRCFFSFKSNIRNAWRKYIVDSEGNFCREASCFRFSTSFDRRRSWRVRQQRTETLTNQRRKNTFHHSWERNDGRKGAKEEANP